MFKSKAISPEVLLGLFETMRRNRHFEGTASPSMVTMLRRCTRLWGKPSNARSAAQLLAEFKRRVENLVIVFR